MHFLLLLVGVVLAGAGAAMVHYALPVEDVAGTALFISGVVALVGAAIMGGLAAAVYQLGRIAERLYIQPLPLPPTASVEREDSAPRPARRAPAAPTNGARPSLLGWLNRGGAAPARPPAALTPVVSPMSPVPAEPAPQADLAALTRVDPPVAPPLSPTPPVRPAARPVATPTPAPNGAANTVYRSGVIDGMAYTLFMDGSIQAELPHGTQKFASVDELQKYLLEKR